MRKKECTREVKGVDSDNRQSLILNDGKEEFVMRIKLAAVGIGFIVLALMSCATLRRDEPVDIYQRTQSYRKFSFDDVWSAALRAVDEVGLMVRSAKRGIGLIHAEGKSSPGPGYSPPLMNVIIEEENSIIDVNFHIEFPGQRDDSGRRRTLANRFFKSLKKNLNRLFEFDQFYGVVQPVPGASGNGVPIPQGESFLRNAMEKLP
jgi:hypothetical protein